ncbi:hypothetical protein [Saccharospirillum mangrovi]|uniref:hypothetical protein n=1 Tax=Saccharospirillum mangrovi TaxID=2161747 RepID=UPI000D37EF37|nr:hypothetical protein [Saccharospirillum mangrovi]
MTPIRPLCCLGLLIQGLLLLAACDSGGKSHSKHAPPTIVEQPDPGPPKVTIQFPTLIALTESDTLRMRGIVTGEPATALAVNGVAADTQDQFAHWSVEVPLVYGENILAVSVTDQNGHTNSVAAQAKVIHSPVLLQQPVAAVLDSVNDRILVLDQARKTLVEVDPHTGRRSLISGPHTPHGGNPFDEPSAFTLDLANNRALVLDKTRRTLLTVDLTTGKRELLSDNTTSNSSNAFSGPAAIVLDDRTGLAQPRALVLDSSSRRLLAVDLNTGERTVVSANNAANNGENPFNSPSDMVLDAANDRVLVIDKNLKKILAVALDTGKRTVLASYTDDELGPNHTSPKIALDSNTNRVWAIAGDIRKLLAVDLHSGEHIRLLDRTGASDSNVFAQTNGLAFDATNQRILVASPAHGALYSVDVTNGERSTVSAAFVPDEVLTLMSPLTVTFDQPNNRTLVFENSLKALLSVDLVTGERTVLSGLDLPNSDHAISNIGGIALNNSYDQLMMADRNIDGLLDVDLITGRRRLLSASGKTGSERELPIAVAFRDNGLKQVLVANSRLPHLVGVDLETGSRTAMFDEVESDSGPVLSGIKDIAMGDGGDQLYALVDGTDYSALLSLDLSKQEWRIILDGALPASAPIFNNPSVMALNRSKPEVLIGDIGLDAIMAVDVVSGNRRVIADRVTPNAENIIGRPFDIALDPINNRALVIDSMYGALVAIDLETGERVIVSQ